MFDVLTATPDSLDRWAQEFGNEVVRLQELVRGLAVLRGAVSEERRRLEAFREEHAALNTEFMTMKHEIEVAKDLKRKLNEIDIEKMMKG